MCLTCNGPSPPSESTALRLWTCCIRRIIIPKLTATQENHLRVLNTAIANFNRSEQLLIKNDFSERCICAKFASYIEKALAGSPFKDYAVDVEYNRGYDGKDNASKLLNDKKLL